MLKQLDQPQRQPPSPSVPAPLEFKFERLIVIAKEVAGLAVAHYESLPESFRRFPLEVDWTRCLEADLHGLVHVLTVRSPRDGGKLVGYCINQVIYPFMHASSKWAFLEALYLAEEYREGLAGYNMLKKNTRGMQMLGCTVIKVFCPLGTFEPLMKRLGYEPLELGFFKFL